MPTCDQMLDALGKKGIEWKRANAAAKAPGATAKAMATLNKVESEFVALRDEARAAVRESGTIKQKARFATLKTVRLVRKAS
jgi:hypothetical protein